MLRVRDTTWLFGFCWRSLCWKHTGYWGCMGAKWDTGGQEVPSPYYLMRAFRSPMKLAPPSPLPFKKVLFFCQPPFHALEFCYSHSRMGALPLLGKTVCLCYWETMSQLALGKEEEARKSPFMMSLPTLPAVSVLGTLVQKLWAVFCPASERMKIVPSLGGCWDHLLVLILGVSIPRLSPSRTKELTYHLHMKCSVVGGTGTGESLC